MFDGVWIMDDYRVLISISLILLIITPLILIPVQVAAQTNLEETIMLEKNRPAVVMVVTIMTGFVAWKEYEQYIKTLGLDYPVPVMNGAFGSGFFVSPDGYIITNGHVVNEFESDLQEKLPLLQDFVETYLRAYMKYTGRQLTQQDVEYFAQQVIEAYTNGDLIIQDYSVQVYVGVGKVVTGEGNIKKMYQARIIDSSPFEKEDLALIKIEIQHAPSLIVSDREVGIGEKVWVMGYPGAVTFHDLLGEETTVIPTITSGIVSGYRDKISGVKVLQSDVAVTHGNSGGPMLDSSGRVIGVTSFGSEDPTGSGREVPGFNFFVPGKYVLEMMSRNNVKNQQDPVMDLWEQGLRLYYGKHYKAAIEKFRLVKELYPGFPYVDDYIANSQAAILRGEDVPLGPDPLMIALIAGVVAAAGGGGAYLYLKKRRRRTSSTPHPPIPPLTQAQHSVDSVQQPVEGVEQIGAGKTGSPNPPGQGYVLTPELQEKRIEMTVKYCWNCGRPIPADAKICPYCGAVQDDEQ